MSADAVAVPYRMAVFNDRLASSLQGRRGWFPVLDGRLMVNMEGGPRTEWVIGHA